MIHLIIKFFNKFKQNRADIDYLLMENDYLQNQNEINRADSSFYSMMLEGEK